MAAKPPSPGPGARKPGNPAKPAPTAAPAATGGADGKTCELCGAENPASATKCSQCGDLLKKKAPPPKKKGDDFVGEYDGSVGTMSPACIAIPIAVLVIIGLFLLWTLRGPRPGTCAHVRNTIATAVAQYNRANPNQKLSTLDLNTLMRPDSKGHTYLKNPPVCPKSSSAQFSFGPDGKVTCSFCGLK